MESNQIGTAFQESFESLKEYLDTQVKYNKLILTQKLGDITSYFALLLIVIALAGGLLLFLSFAFAFWFAKVTNLDVYYGYLIISAFYLILIVIAIRFREKLLFNPIRKLLGTILFEEEIQGETTNPFGKREDLKKTIKVMHYEMQEQQKLLHAKFHQLNETLTFVNISQQIFQSVYAKVVTSTNVAKLAFLLIKRLKRKRPDKTKKAAD
ncbi:MAG: hypothetical protein Q8O72_06465 [Bacteroidales bacterium]|nr:hypothetical protein [Bacteroidales bacterium]